MWWTSSRGRLQRAPKLDQEAIPGDLNDATVVLIKLSPSEKWTLQKVKAEFHVSELDWLALQHLKIVEDRPAGVGITKEGRRVLRRLIAKS